MLRRQCSMEPEQQPLPLRAVLPLQPLRRSCTPAAVCCLCQVRRPSEAFQYAHPQCHKAVRLLRCCVLRRSLSQRCNSANVSHPVSQLCLTCHDRHGRKRSLMLWVLCSLAPQASPWGTIDGGAAGTLAHAHLERRAAGAANPVAAQVPTSQASLASWGISPGDSSSHHAQQQWMPNSGRHMATRWSLMRWPAHGSSGLLTAASWRWLQPQGSAYLESLNCSVLCPPHGCCHHQLHLLQHLTDRVRLITPGIQRCPLDRI